MADERRLTPDDLVTGYARRQWGARFPRLPLSGALDLTYRCHFNCRHCWLRIPPGAAERRAELTFEEIRALVDEARSLGCREWSISGGEPMLRPDFAEILAYITRKGGAYALNTNGSLITPQIAQLLRRRGNKMVSLYGATAEVFDHVTRMPGSFERTMQGFAYLKEAGAGFVVQIVPMRANYHQYQDMVRLAASLSPYRRIGAIWLFLTADGDRERDDEIRRQRLEPREVVAIDPPIPPGSDPGAGEQGAAEEEDVADGRVFANCVAHCREFHVDPYGGLSMCAFVKDPTLRYNLRQGTLREAWDSFIPSLVQAESAGSAEYRQNCATCELRKECHWCPAFGYLEHRRFSAKVEHLCALAQEIHRCKELLA